MNWPTHWPVATGKAEIMKELGDVMEHVVFYAMLGDETGDFDIADVCNHQSDKLMFRHTFIDWNDTSMLPEEAPAWSVSSSDMAINDKGQVVYRTDLEAERRAAAEGKPATALAVEQTWEQVKQRERDGNKSVLSGVPDSLPSIIKAYRVQDKARNVGFDWEKPADVRDKVREELGELEEELKRGDHEASEHELGDFLFSVINAARLYRLNPDNALEHTNHKFIRRFNYVEQQAKAQGRSIKELTLEEMDRLWDEAKQKRKETRINTIRICVKSLYSWQPWWLCLSPWDATTNPKRERSSHRGWRAWTRPRTTRRSMVN